MGDVDAASERNKNLWTWIAITLWAGFVVWAIAGRDPADGKGGAKPSAHATQSITPSPTEPSRSLPAEPARDAIDGPVEAEGASVSDVELPRTPSTPPGRIKLRREKAAQCGVSVLAPTKLRHELQGGIGQPAVVDTYTADATWGAVVVSCLRDDPAPPYTDINVAAESALQNLRSAPEWKVVRERNVRIGKHIATEVDAVAAASGPVRFARWRLFVVGDVIHLHTLMSQYDPSSVPELDTLLDSVKLNKRAGRGLSRSAITVWSPGQSSASGSSWSSVLPSLNTGGDVHVRGYHRSDGTYVRPHTRSRPKR